MTVGLSCVIETAFNPSTSDPPPATDPPPQTDPVTEEPPPEQPPPDPSAGSPVVRFLYPDTEPNDDLATAVAAFLATPSFPDQAGGFFVLGAINNLTDGIDTFSFTAERTLTFSFELCDFRDGYACSASPALDPRVAYLSVLDQFGTELASSRDTGTDPRVNVLQWPIDAGLIYYVMVLAENTSGVDQAYRLEVTEVL